jgi:hypothetical protein
MRKVVRLATILTVAIGVVSLSASAAYSGKPCGCAKKATVPLRISMSYPICVYDVDTGAVDADKAAWPQYRSSLEKLLRSVTASNSVVQIVSSRAAIVVTNGYKIKQIDAIWPSVACIGQSGGEESENRRQICTNYMSEKIRLSDRAAELPSYVPRPTCQTFLDIDVSP